MTRYSTVVVDPPWPQKGAGPLKGGHGEGFLGTTGSQPMPYSVMSLEEIAALPLGDIAARDAHLYLWATNGFLEDAYRVVRAWGFRHSTTLVWAKKPMGGGLGGAYGISTEFILYARRGSLAPLRRERRTWFEWKRPYNTAGKPMHSGKPPEAFELIASVSPGPRLSMFERTERQGFDVWGDQAPAPVDLAAMRPLTDCVTDLRNTIGEVA